MFLIGPSKKIFAWYEGENASLDFSVKGLLDYAKLVDLDLPNPTSEKDIPRCLTVWREGLESHQIRLIQEFIGSTVERNVGVDQTLRQMISKAAAEVP